MKRNVPVLGLIIGLITPFIGMVVVYLIMFHDNTFQEFLNALKFEHDVAAKVITLSLIANLVPFIFFTSKRLDLSARGILVATVLYGVLVLLLKFVW